MRQTQATPDVPDVPLPVLFSDDEIDARLVNTEKRDRREFQPIAIVRRHNPEIAAQLELLWGSSSFDELVEAIAFGTGRRPLRHDVLNAILALGRMHSRGREVRPSISAWVSDPTLTRPRPIR